MGKAGLVFLVAAAVAGSAHAQSPKPIDGPQFTALMRNNTLSGKTKKGAPFNVYFQSGGVVTYEESGGFKDTGKWDVVKGDAGDLVCLKWQKRTPGKWNCYVVRVAGSRLMWDGAAKGSGSLRGGIAETFLKKR